MEATSSSEDSQVLIATQLNTLHLYSGLTGGGESIRESVETEDSSNLEETELKSIVQVKKEPYIKKEEDFSRLIFSKDAMSKLPLSKEDDDSIKTVRSEAAPQKDVFRAQLDGDDLMIVDEVNVEERRAQLRREMEIERERFSGASNWAPEEVRLFELLYMREYLAMMPRHWTYDFSGVPFQDHVFQTSDENPPVIYAHCRLLEFQATKGMMNLIDLSSRVRTLLQSGFQSKAPVLIAKTLNDFLAWAAHDGDYHRREIIPNLIAEVVETDADHVAVIKSRMEALAQLHRDFLRVDRNDHGWQGVKNEVLDQGFLMAGSPPRSAKSRSKRRITLTETSPEERASFASSAASSFGDPSSHLAGHKRKRSPDDQMAAPGRRKLTRYTPPGDAHHLTPRTPANKTQQSTFTRQPPVVWGLFIINTSVFLCTLDASKEGDDAYVSWHAEIAFSQTRQCVWHALTVALVVCLARDELMTRLDDFEVLPIEKEEDPDL